MDARTELLKTYTSAPAFGLVLGAGVTAASKVPVYVELAQRVLQQAVDEGLLDDHAVRLLHDHRFAGSHRQLPPDALLSFARAQIDDEVKLHDFVREALYRDVPVPEPFLKAGQQEWPVKRRTATTHLTVSTRVYKENSTLDAIIRFCAAQPGAAHAGLVSPRAPVATNRRVGAIVTTNYDNLVETSFGTKHGKPLLKPVGRFPIGRGVGEIPVLHCHGYVPIMVPEGASSVPSPLLISEEDYFEASYDTRSFGNVVLAYVLQQMPCLFIGSAMTDQNLRRHLLRRGDEGTRRSHRHFAVLPRTAQVDGLTDAILDTYGVTAIRIDRYQEIHELMKKLYLAAPGVTEDDWAWTGLPRTTRPRRAS